MPVAVFLDRDGVLNEVLVRDNLPCSPRSLEEFHLYPGTESELARLKKAGYLLIVITNQPELTRGLLDPKELTKMHQKLLKDFPIDEIFVCPHDNADCCACRKPKPGMLLKAAEKWEIDLKQSFFVGDTVKDLEAGRAVGCTTILLNRFYNEGLKPDFRFPDIGTAVTHILTK